jgi:hypothetical protein
MRVGTESAGGVPLMVAGVRIVGAASGAGPPDAVAVSDWRRVGVIPARVSASRSSASSRPV